MTSGGLDGLDPKLLASLVERVRDAVLVYSGDGTWAESTIVYANDAFLALSGYDLDELVGRGPGFMVGPDTDPETVRRLLAALAEGRSDSEEVVFRRKDGGKVWVDATGFMLPGEGGRSWFCGLYRDVTDRALVVERLRASEQWAQALVEGSADMILVVDDQGTITYVSPAVRAVLGYEPTEIEGSNCLDFVHPDTGDQLARDWIELSTDPTRYMRAQYRVQHADGSWRYLSISARNLLEDAAIHGIVIHGRDTTERAEAEERLRQSEEWAQALVQGGFEVVAVSDDDGKVLYVSPAVEDVLGYPPDEFIGTSAFEYAHPDDAELVRRVFDNEVHGGGTKAPTRIRLRHLDGHWVQTSLLFTNMLDHPAVAGVVINGRDITDRWRAQQLLGQQARALEAIARGAPLDTTLYGLSQMIEEHVEGSHAALAVLGDEGAIRVRAAPSLDRDLVLALDQLDPGSALGRALRSSERVEVFPNLVDDERWTATLAVAPTLADRACWSMVVTTPGTKEPLGALLVFASDGCEPSDVEAELLERLMNIAAIAIERRNFESTLEYQALHDDLTGLPNRTLMLDRIAQSLARARRHGTNVAVLFVDLDRFKVLNDSLGHAVGDQLLVQVAERFQRPLKLGDALGRFGGDEFLVVCDRLEREADAVDLAERLALELTAPFVLGDGEVFVTASIGIAASGEAPVSAESLIRNADMAMYRAKDAGRAGHAVFEEDLHLRMLERHELEQALRTALDLHEFDLHYQPLIRLSDGATTGVEALVRWNRPGHGLVEPASFIPVAEETGIIVPLGEWIMDRACRQAAAWPTLPDGDELHMTINLSARQLAQPDLIDLISQHLESNNLEPGHLCFEVTESVLMEDVKRAVGTLEEIKELGVCIAIDDFGTGYATLDYLRRFSMADYLKIDRSFVEGVDRGGSQEMAIVAGAVSLAKSLGFIVVAEGVQTEGQLAALRGLDCDLGQGYYFSRPLPAEAAVALLASTPRWT